MLVWHIHYEPYAWLSHAVNNDAYHQHVDIIEADALLTEATRSGDSFPGSAGVTSITPSTNPCMTTWSGRKIELAITEITENPDGRLTFTVGAGAPPAASVEALAAVDVTPRSFVASWKPSADAVDYRIKVYTRDADGIGSSVAGYENRLTGNVSSIVVKGLEPSVEYFYTVSVITEVSQSLPSNEIAVTTAPLTHEYVIPVAYDAENVDDNGFTASWAPEAEGYTYLLDVDRVKYYGAVEDTESFDDKNMMWNSNSTTYYSATSYVGNSSPSLRLVTGQYVATPMLERGKVRSFGFWHRAHGVDDLSALVVEAYANGCWSLCDIFHPVEAKGGATICVRDFPGDAVAVRLTFVDPSGNGSIYVDDFKTLCSASVDYQPVEGFHDFDAGTATECVVNGLEPGTDYRYAVRAVNDRGEVSLPSSPVYLHTAGVSSLALPCCDAPVVKVNGRSVTVDTPATLYDLSGRVVGIAEAGSAITVAAPGLYLLETPVSTIKISIR